MKIIKLNQVDLTSIKRFILNFRTIIVFGALFLLFSCSNKKNTILDENTILFSKFSKEEKLQFEEVFEFTEGAPGILHLVDSTLMMLNVNPNVKSSLFNYSLKSKSLSKGYLSRGRGPGESIGAVNFGIKGKHIWVFDVVLKKILLADKSKISAINTNLLFEEFPIKDYYYTVCLKDSLSYYGVGANHSEFKVQEMDLIYGGKMNEFGEFKSIPNNMSIESAKQIFQSFIYVNPSGNKIVLPCRFTDIVEIYDTQTQTSKVLHGPIGFDVDYNLVGGNMHRTKETRHAFVGGAVTDKYIYLLYSGTLDIKNNPYYGKEIYMYDLEKGVPIKKMILDREVLSITVSEDDKTIYAYDTNNGFIVKANLNRPI